MPRCDPCNRSFGSDAALRQHVRDAPAHGSQRTARAPVETPTTFFTFPQLHQAVLDEAPELSPAPAFTEKATQGHKESYPTFIIAAFSCRAHGPAPATWSSGQVSITIRLHQGNRYSAVVYNQRCKRCKRLGFIKVDERSYVERVAYRLKKWAGIEMDVPVYPKKMTPPHRADLCEGCKAGTCKYGPRANHDDF